jgi:signal transduction histidine kinase
MGAIGPNRAHARREPERAGFAALLQRISSLLIRASDHNLRSAIETALSEMAEALGADRALVAPRLANGFAGRYLWERRGVTGRVRWAAAESPDSPLERLDLEQTLVCGNRRQFTGAILAGARLPVDLASAIVVPLPNDGKTGGVLAVISRTPRSWTPDAVKATEWFAEMVAAGLDRMVTLSSLHKEQEKRLHAEAETRRLREQLAHAGRVSMLGELAASLAHELNQPLTAIYTNAQAAQRFLDRKPPTVGEATAALYDLGQDCRRAADVLGRMRQMFRRHEPERVPLSIGPVIEHVLRLLHEEAVTREVKVGVDVKPGLPMVNGDRVQLEQVLMNLLVNAFDAVTGLPGPREVTVRASARSTSVELSVLDTGKGLGRRETERVFEPFFTRKPNGMGMGLAICRTIVEAHGGRVTARNRAERGAVFEITLPAIPAETSRAG